jgi:single-strand DNA-binding protein
MSKGVNISILLGNLGKDPRIAYNEKGLPICNFDMATTERYRSEIGEWKEDTEWHRIVVFGTFGTTCAQKLVKGSQVLVIGRKNTRGYKIKDETTERKVTEVIAREVVFCGPAPAIPKEQEQIPDNSDARDFDSDDIPF